MGGLFFVSSSFLSHEDKPFVKNKLSKIWLGIFVESLTLFVFLLIGVLVNRYKRLSLSLSLFSPKRITRIKNSLQVVVIMI